MKTFFAWILGIIVFVVVCIALFAFAFGAKWLGLEWRGYWGPKEQNVEREIYEGTRSFNAGMERDLADLARQYYLADNQQSRDVIASTARHRFAAYDVENEVENRQALQFWLEINNVDQANPTPPIHRESDPVRGDGTPSSDGL